MDSVAMAAHAFLAGLPLFPVGHQQEVRLADGTSFPAFAQRAGMTHAYKPIKGRARKRVTNQLSLAAGPPAVIDFRRWRPYGRET